MKKTINNPFTSYLIQSRRLKKSSTRRNNNTLSLMTTLAASALMVSDSAAQCGAGNYQSTGSEAGLDIDGDGIADFQFYVSCSGSSFFAYMTVVGTKNFAVEKLNFGDVITPANAGSITSSVGTLVSYFGNAPTNSFTFYIAISDDDDAVGFLELTYDTSGPCTVLSLDLDNSAIEESPFGNVRAGDCSSLPATIGDFSAKAVESKIMLSWETYSEINNEGFEVQKSKNGKDYKAIGWVKGEGNSHTSLEYGFTDRNVESNTNYYYRLKQKDYSGNFEYSDVVFAKSENILLTTISDIAPNPTGDITVIGINSIVEQSALVEVFNNSGILISSSRSGLRAGSNRIEVNTTSVAAGIYYIKVQAGEALSYQRLVVLK